MGRGLSDLQKCILRLALKEGKDLHKAVILHAYYGWEPKPGYWHGDPLPPEKVLRGYGQIFTSTEIENYESAQAAVSRAVTRLRARGLLEEDWREITLSEAGKEVAKSIG